jgi:hypothetical protein
MRLSREQVEKISDIIFNTLKGKKLLIFKTDEATVLNRIVELFIQDLRAEDKLDREVEDIMKTHAKEIDDGRMDYRRMFNLIKSKLAREREIVL